MNAFGHMKKGDMALARRESEKAIGAALDPFYAQFAKPGLGISYFMDGQLPKNIRGPFRFVFSLCITDLDPKELLQVLLLLPFL